MDNILVLILGLAASCLMVVAGLTTHRRKLFTLNASISLLSVSQYFLLGSLTAMIIGCISVVRNIMLAGFEHKYPQVNTLKVAIFFSGLHILAFTLTTNPTGTAIPPYEFLPLIGALVGSFASFWKHMIPIKIFMVISGLNWLTFEIIKGAYGQVVGETLTLVANITAITYLSIQHARLGKNVPDDEIEDLSTHIIDIITTPIQTVKKPGKVKKLFTTSPAKTVREFASTRK